MTKTIKTKIITVLFALFSVVIGAASFLSFSRTAKAEEAANNNVFRIDSASVRLPDETYGNGLRFHVVMPKAQYEALGAKTTGALVVPYQKLSSGATVDVSNTDAINVAFESSDWHENANGDYEAYVVLTEIPDANVGNLIAVRAYVQDGSSYTYTAQKSATLSAVALGSYNNAATSAEDKAILKANYLEEVTYHDGATSKTEVVASGSVLSQPEGDKVWYTADCNEYSFATTRVKSALDLYAVNQNNYIDSSSNAASVDLSSFTSNGYTVSSLAIGSVSLGNNAAAIDGTSLASLIGNQTLSVSFTSGASISVPVTVVNGIITTADQFITNVRASDKEKSGYYVLGNDIDINSKLTEAWNWNNFKGTLDGNGHTITAKQLLGGVFQNLDSATIKNVTIKNAWVSSGANSSLLARQITNSTLDNVTVTLTGGSTKDISATGDNIGLLTATRFSGNTINNLHIEATDYKVGSVFGGTNSAGFGSNICTFTNSWIKCESLAEIGHGTTDYGWNATNCITQVNGFEINPETTCTKHEYVCVAGETEDIVKCKNCNKEVLTFKKTVTAKNQFVAKTGNNNVSLSGIGEYASVVSVKLANVSLGNSISALDISSANVATGANTLTVVVRDSYGCDHSISVPVTVVDGIITTADQFITNVRASDKEKSGYYVLGNDIDINSKLTEAWNWNNFKGTLDGNGHTITAKQLVGGVFQNLDSATIKNVTIKNAWVSSGANSSLLARQITNSTLDNVTVTLTGGSTKDISATGDNIGLLTATRFSGNTINNLHIEATGYKVGSVFGGTNSAGFGSNICTFTNSWIKCESLAEIGHGTTDYGWNATNCITQVDGFTVNDATSGISQSVTTSEVVNLCITDGNVNQTATHTFKSYGIKQEYLTAIKFNGETLGNEGFSVPVKNFGKTYGEGVVTLYYKIGSKTGSLDVPVILATYVLTTSDDVDNFLTYANAYTGNSEDGVYDGYFALGNDISYNKEYTTLAMDSAKGFRGVFDGRGYAIQGLKILGAYNDAANALNKTAFISVLHDDGVIKNVAFTGAQLFRRAFLASSGGGLVENVFIDVNLVTASDGYTVIANSDRNDYRSVQLKNCVINYSGTPSAYLLGRVPETANAYIGVYLIGAAQNTYVTYASNDAVTYDATYGYARGNDNFAQYATIEAFLADRGGEMKGAAWAYFDATGSALKFGEKAVLSASAAVTANDYVGNTLISANKQSSDYVIIYADNDYAQNAAAFIAEHIARATGTIAYEAKGISGSNDWSSQTLTGGIRLPMMTGAPHAYNNNAAFIVIGDVEIEGLSYPNYNGDYLVATLGNSVLIRAKNAVEYITAATLFLEETIGYSALSDDTVYYHNVKANTAVTVSSFSHDTSAAYAVRSNINFHRTWKNDQMALNGRDHFAIGPTDASGKVQTFHNSIYWLDYGKSGADYNSSWFRSYTHANVNYTDVCYTNLLDGSKTNGAGLTAVQLTAKNMRKVLIENPGETELTFSLQDNDTSGCTCSGCKNNHTNQAIAFLNAVAEEIVRLDTVDGVENREFTVYILAYYYLLAAPTVDMNSHLGVIYAPVRYSSEGASVYDSKNATTKAQIEAWAAKTNHIGFWFYDTLYHNYFISIDTFESMLTWLEYAARTVKAKGNDVAWIYINGQTAQPNPSAFESFKNYVYSRAQVEILNKLGSLTGGSTEYNNAIKSYLNELENEFFARTGDVFTDGNYGTFSDGGYYGAAAANEAMYKLYRQMRTDYAKISSDKTTAEYLDAMKEEEWALSHPTYNMFNEYVAKSGNKNGYLQKYTKTMMQTYMGYVDAATAAAAAYTGDMACVYSRHVLAESLAPRFLMCMSADSYSSSYKYIPSGSTASSIRTAFKTDCATLGISYYGESRTLASVYTFWGI